MNHQDHVNLLKKGILQAGGVWADFGAGSGAFTLALAGLIGPGGIIFAVDKNGRDLKKLENAFYQNYPDLALHTIKGDFTRPLSLPPLDGLVMANSLHFIRNKEPVVQRLRDYLKVDGRFLLVEYNVNRGNVWVPHPISYTSWAGLAERCGFSHTEFLAARPSRFLHEIYTAVSWN